MSVRCMRFVRLVLTILIVLFMVESARVSASGQYANGAIQSEFGPSTQASPPSGSTEDPCEDGDCEIVGTGVDPVQRTPQILGRRCPPWQEDARRTRRSTRIGWLS
jgi:hypothetical protein